ncbi:hypothetical protein [Streptomyces stelliscabiei]|uniref:Uncharacterized protein n=1 Tax=Streptomyces stelliscabiei TaxID=146820 RepID=A0A8I0TVV5_9ACTN|nr:hypothetical protein [Streptomyces stelliscabiei]KND29887.1 hypothetical protein IQ64_41805 [Streptomyces stelliscabiei]MBE1598995.1 hypothetical protein [Streptomyces stelliscabiei]MBE1599738.1 hypothetical protein [Streptomyces stelliscabiei]MDX2519396.1 hypothetical protein [Streptomyces stelliscabiei]MDX2549675.1 hypothetical protein [Streptomyces stelliscabiei]
MPTTPHPTRGTTPCNRCGALIRWASGPRPGERTPINALPSPAGGLAARTTGLGGLVVREFTREEPDCVPALLEWKAVSHFSSCAPSSPQPPTQTSRPARRRPTVQAPLWGQPQRGLR